MRVQNPAWETLRRVGQARLMGLTAFMPIIGYMILLNNELASYLELNKLLVPDEAAGSASQIAGQLSEAARSRLYFIYFGLTSLGLGSIIYSLFCPRIQKEHSADFIYIREEIGLLTERRATSAIEYLRRDRHLNETMKLNLEIIENGLQAKALMKIDKDLVLGNHEMLKKELMLMLYQNANWSNGSARISTTALYFAGFILLAIPSVQVFFGSAAT